MIKVIVNADDFGLDENRTRAILAAYQQGWVSTTTVMANMPWFERAIEGARGTPLYEHIGLHLNLTEGRPLTEKIRASPLFCDSDGVFNARFHRDNRYRLWLPAFERQAVAEESAAQFEKYRAVGLSFFHLDSHHHVHTDWSVAKVILPLARHFGFKTIRRSRNFGAGLSPIKRAYKYFLNRKLAKAMNFNADYFCGFVDLADEKRRALLPRECVVEVMTHPQYKREEEFTLDGELTEYGGRASIQQSFWHCPPVGISLIK